LVDGEQMVDHGLSPHLLMLPLEVRVVQQFVCKLSTSPNHS